MKNYYNIETFERKDIPDKIMQEWIENNNPKAAYYQPTPVEPIYNPITQYITWGNGEWTISDINQEVTEN